MNQTFGLTRDTPLPFVIELAEGLDIASVGDVESCLRNLTDDQREQHQWAIAVRMFANAMKEPVYLKAATMSLQTALAMDGLLVRLKS